MEIVHVAMMKPEAGFDSRTDKTTSTAWRILQLMSDN